MGVGRGGKRKSDKMVVKKCMIIFSGAQSVYFRGEVTRKFTRRIPRIMHDSG